jgi:hypothetical protein
MADTRGQAEYMPLIFALKDLRIRYYPDQLNSPVVFTRSTCLLRGDAVLPSVDDSVVDSCVRHELSDLPPDPMEALMR